MNNIIESRKKVWKDLLDDVSSCRNAVTIECPFENDVRPFPRWDNVDERIEWNVREYNAQIERLEWLDDDNIPHVYPYAGTELFAEAFGCKVHYPDNDMPFAIHMLDDYSEISKLKVPSIWDTKLSILFDITHKLKERTDKNAIIRLPDIQSPMDIAALILDKQLFYMSFIEESELIEELAYKTRTLLIEFLDEWFKEFGTEFIAHHPYYYMNGGITFSEDEVGCISDNMFNEYFTEGIEQLTSKYGTIGIHCCANARHQWENFKKVPNLKFLNIEQPKEVVEEANEFFKDTCIMVHTLKPHYDVSSWVTKFSDTKMIINVISSDRDDALRNLEKYKG